MKKITIMTICCCFMACLVTGTGFAIAPGGCVVEEKQLPLSSETAGGCVVKDHEKEKVPLQAADPEIVQVTLTEAPQDIEVKRGSQLKINIASNPTTGYSWEIEDFKPSLLEFTERAFASESAGAGEKKRPGSGGTEIFTFRAKKAGDCSVVFWYKRPWENNEPAKTYTLTVQVK